MWLQCYGTALLLLYDRTDRHGCELSTYRDRLTDITTMFPNKQVTALYLPQH